MKHNIDDLRDHLFATLEALRDTNKPMEIERAKAIAEVSAVVIDSAKVEVKYLELTGAAGGGFIPTEKKPDALPGPNGGKEPATRVHRLR
jgi:2-methylaconitate cis-trans-isomerase PrpF